MIFVDDNLAEVSEVVKSLVVELTLGDANRLMVAQSELFLLLKSPLNIGGCEFLSGLFR